MRRWFWRAIARFAAKRAGGHYVTHARVGNTDYSYAVSTTSSPNTTVTWTPK